MYRFMMTRKTHLLNEAFTIQNEGDNLTASALFGRISPLSPDEACAFLFAVLGEGDKQKMDWIVNAAIAGMVQAHEAERRDSEAGEEIFKFLARNN